MSESLGLLGARHLHVYIDVFILSLERYFWLSSAAIDGFVVNSQVRH